MNNGEGGGGWRPGYHTRHRQLS